MKKTYLYIILILLFASCEKVIEIDLNEADSRIVVDGKINFSNNGLSGEAYVQLHWTGSFYENNTFETIDNAQVKVSDKQGIVYTLTHSSNGQYFNPNIQKGQLGDTYKLEIQIDGKPISSQSSLARSVLIDSLSYTLDSFGPKQGDGYNINCHFTDPAGEVNYYYLKIKINGIYSSGYFLSRDDAMDGKPITYTFFRNPIKKPSNVEVELYTLDETSFEYFKVLAMQQQGGMSTAPGNPPSNIEGEAIGVFRANYMDIQSISVP